MGDAFRDAIAQAIDCTYFFGTEAPHEENVTEANAILAMAEMEGIRFALLHAATNAARKAFPASPLATRTGTEKQQDDTVRHYLRTNCKLTHESVIDWVVGT